MKKFHLGFFAAIIISSLLVVGCEKGDKTVNKETKTSAIDNQKGSPTLYYLAHASVKIKTSKGIVIYIDPAYGEDYSEPADIVLVTHFHDDHYKLDKISNKKKYKLITFEDALKNEVYQKFDVMGIKIEAVPAYNANHDKSQTVGYILDFDGIKLYHAGDTSKIKEMENLPSKKITYALLPMDGVYNMGPEEAAEAAKVIKAKYYIPIHTGPDGVFSEENISKFGVENKVVLKPGTSIVLKP